MTTETGYIVIAPDIDPEQTEYSLANLIMVTGLSVRKIRALMARGQFPSSYLKEVRKISRYNSETGKTNLLPKTGERWNRAEVDHWKKRYFSENPNKAFDEDIA